jgi:hypothetical protein
MKGFLLGLLVAGLAFGGYLAWRAQAPPEPTATAAPDGGAIAKKRRRRARGAARARADRPGVAERGRAGAAPREAPVPEEEPEPVRLSAADLKIVAQGEELSRPEIVRLDMADDRPGRELGQEEIDAVFREREAEILDCIGKARPDPETYVPGRVSVKFRIQRSGEVRGVRVEAPAVLQRGGIYGCVKAVVGRMRFPRSDAGQIVTYPFTLS